MPPSIPLLELDFQSELTAFRRDIHAHPELAFNENRTAEMVAGELERYGLEVHRGIARTGVVGVLRAGTSQRMIGLRADMDALPLAELNEFPHHSRHLCRMHACGHDGHTALLLGAARYLAAHPEFDGIAVFIFQPAEESEGGAAVMIEDGLFERFPVEAARAQRTGEALSLVMFDLDHFKAINDAHGHPAGDRALREVVRAVSGQLRDGDLLGRIGGEEFVVLLPNINPDKYQKPLENLRQTIKSIPFRFRDARVEITISIGATLFRTGDHTTDAFERADKALYSSKHSGRDQVNLA